MATPPPADAGVAVSVANDGEAEALIRELHAVGYHVAAPGACRSIPEGRHGFAGVPRASGGLGGPRLGPPCWRVGDLIALKILARDDERRPQDRVDLHALRVKADAATWDLARTALTLITERRFNRGRDLLAALEQLRATSPAPTP